ncbi:MAG: amidase [Luminiphilus sp.]|nr:amidase [Luminiphilus sp.]
MDNESIAMGGLLEVSQLVKNGEISSTEVTRTILERIERLNPEYKIFNTVSGDLAMEQAQAADTEIQSGKYRGPLHGLPVAVKDIIDTAGVRTTYGSGLFREHMPSEDATVIQKFKAAGAVTIGKLATTEFALYGYADDFEVPLNPWSKNHWVGVSSSGSGACVAAGLAFASLGTDTGGSIRFPSAACGAVGLKPTFGRVSRKGVFPLADTLDHVGPMTRRAVDSAIVLQALEGQDSGDPFTKKFNVSDYSKVTSDSPGNITVGIDIALCTEGIDPEITHATLEARGILEGLGIKVVEVEASGLLEGLEHLWLILAAEATHSHRHLYPERALDYGPVFRDLLEIGHGLSGPFIAEGNVRRYRAIAAAAALFETVDALLMPATSMTPIPVEEFPPQQVADVESFPAMLRTTGPFNFTGNPTLNLTAGFSKEDLPLAIQFAGRHGEEETLFKLAHAFETEAGHYRKLPPFS